LESVPLNIRGLRKRFGRSEVLAGIDLAVPRGAIYGFVGLNGAGKTTTLECALGLLRFQAGEISLLGRPPREIHQTRGRAGVAFDTPCLHPGLTVRDELEHGWLIAGRQGRGPDEVAALAGIGGRLHQKTRKLSLGERRRLSIALALLGSPELVILDEPFSSLDAGGVEDMLALICRLRQEDGATILFSSHQLDLVERISTHLGLIHEGRMLREGRVADLLHDGRPRLRMEVDAPERALAVLRGRWPDLRAEARGPGTIEVDLDGAAAAEINAALVRSGIAVSELRAERPSLAALFRELTGERR
jgi:ABC-2 type transport system ATP-binding protein